MNAMPAYPLTPSPARGEGECGGVGSFVGRNKRKRIAPILDALP
jgi:hypothetical protein